MPRGHDSGSGATMLLRFLPEQLIHRYPPLRHGRLGLCDLPAPVDGRMLRTGRPVDSDNLLAAQINIPHDLSASGKIVGSTPDPRKRPI
jgi:hypothetical protein